MNKLAKLWYALYVVCSESPEWMHIYIRKQWDSKYPKGFELPITLPANSKIYTMLEPCRDVDNEWAAILDANRRATVAKMEFAPFESNGMYLKKIVILEPLTQELAEYLGLSDFLRAVMSLMADARTNNLLNNLTVGYQS